MYLYILTYLSLFGFVPSYSSYVYGSYRIIFKLTQGYHRMTQRMEL
jgi:hypothetical protein